MDVTATNLKTRLGSYLDFAEKESVFIEKSGRIKSVLMSIEQYNSLIAKVGNQYDLDAMKKHNAQLQENLNYLQTYEILFRGLAEIKIICMVELTNSGVCVNAAGAAPERWQREIASLIGLHFKSTFYQTEQFITQASEQHIQRDLRQVNNGDKQFHFYDCYFADEVAERIIILSVDVSQTIQSMQTQQAGIANEEKIRMEQLAKLSFFESVGDELRIPMTVLVALCDQLGRELKHSLEDRPRQLLTRIMEHSQHFLQMMDTLLEIASLEIKKHHLSLHRFNIIHAVVESVEAVSHSFNAAQVSLASDLPTEPIFVLLDRKRVLFAIKSLLSIGLKENVNGQIQLRLSTVVTSEFGEQVVLSVRDKGKGMTYEKMLELMSLEVALTDKKNLDTCAIEVCIPLVKKLARLLGGALSLSQDSDGGTLYTLSFPLQPKISIDKQHFFE